MVVAAVLHDQAVTASGFRCVNDLPTVFERISSRDFGAHVFSFLQRSEHLRDMPFPGRSNVDEIKIVTRREMSKVALAVGIDRGRLLTSLFNHPSRAYTFFVDDIAHGVDRYLVDRQKLTEHICSTEAHANHPDPHAIARLKLHTDHRLLFPSSLCFSGR